MVVYGLHGLPELLPDSHFCFCNCPVYHMLGLPVPISFLRSPWSQLSLMGLFFNLIPYFRCPPPGSGVSTTTSTGDLNVTGLNSNMDNGCVRHPPLEINVSSLPQDLYNLLPEGWLKTSLMARCSKQILLMHLSLTGLFSFHPCLQILLSTRW